MKTFESVGLAIFLPCLLLFGLMVGGLREREISIKRGYLIHKGTRYNLVEMVTKYEQKGVENENSNN